MTNVVDDAARGIERAASSARETIGAAAGEATRTVRQAADGQRERGADAIECLANAVRAAGREFGATSPAVSRYVDDAAGGLVRASRAMREQSAPELLRRTAELARQQPAMAFAGAILAGIAMSRFIKSSAARDGSGSGDGNRRRGATSGDYGRSREEDAHAYGPGVSGFGTAGTATPATGSGGETLGRADRRAEGSFAADKPTEMP